MKEKDNLGEDLNKSMWASKKFRMVLVGLVLLTGTGVGMTVLFPAEAAGLFFTYCGSVTTLVLGYIGVEGTSDAMVKKKIAEKRGDALVASKTPVVPPPEPEILEDSMNIPIESAVHRIHRGPPPLTRG